MIKLNKSRDMIRAALRNRIDADCKVHEAFTLAYDTAVSAGVTRDRAGIDVLSLAVNSAILHDADIVSLALGSGFKMSTLRQYASGLKRAYVAGEAWTPSSHRLAPQFPWKKKDAAEGEAGEAGEAGEGLAADKAAKAKPSKPESVTQDALRLELAKVVRDARALGFVDLAKKIFDAVLASPLKPTAPSK